MPEKNYAPAQQATLLLLMWERRDIPNPELANDHKIRLEQDDRAELNEDGVLESAKLGRSLVHHLTAAGRIWCEKALPGIEPAPRSGPLARVVFAIARDQAGNRGASWAGMPEQDGWEPLIRAAYQNMAGKPHEWVRLAVLRQKLTESVDETLLAMTKTGLVHLAPQSNRRALVDADRAAAINVAGEANHLVAIEEP